MEVISIYLMMMQKAKIFCSTYLNNIYATNILYRAVRKVWCSKLLQHYKIKVNSKGNKNFEKRIPWVKSKTRIYPNQAFGVMHGNALVMQYHYL